MLSKGFKLFKEGLVNKMGSSEPKHWIVKNPTFSLVRVIIKNWENKPMQAIFKCRQTGELVNLRCRVA